MPPKKQNAKEQVKRVIEDKTFGMKNKKGGKAQKFIQQIQTSEQHKQGVKNEEEMKKQREKEKKEREEVRNC